MLAAASFSCRCWISSSALLSFASDRRRAAAAVRVVTPGEGGASLVGGAMVAWSGVGGTNTQHNDHEKGSLWAVLIYVLYTTHDIYILRIFSRYTKVRIKYHVEAWPGKGEEYLVHRNTRTLYNKRSTRFYLSWIGMGGYASCSRRVYAQKNIKYKYDISILQHCKRH